jgi:drug/metabolite transporter superfamily protein YnfA
VLVGYRVVPTFQPPNFGRAHATYGGVFVAIKRIMVG